MSRRHAEPLLQLPRHRRARWCCWAWWRRTSWRCTTSARTTPTASRSRARSPEGRQRQAAGRHPVPPVLHGARHLRRRGVPDGLLRDHLLRAGTRRLLPGVQQLHPGRSAEDAGAHRAGLVLHAVLLDAARHHHRDDVRAVRHPAADRGLGAGQDSAPSLVKGSLVLRRRGIPVDVRRLRLHGIGCCKASTPSSGAWS